MVVSFTASTLVEHPYVINIPALRHFKLVSGRELMIPMLVNDINDYFIYSHKRCLL